MGIQENLDLKETWYGEIRKKGINEYQIEGVGVYQKEQFGTGHESYQLELFGNSRRVKKVEEIIEGERMRW